jgi:hypothetical protein
VVDVRDTTGGLSRYTAIPGGSVFESHGGSGQPCSFTSLYGGIASNGVEYLPGQVVESMNWIFIEGDLVAFGEPNLANPNGAANGPLSQAVRHFAVFCDSIANFLGMVDVPATDPMLNPRWSLVNLYNQMQLERPVVYPNPVVDRWGGLITRYSAWLAIRPSAWRTQSSNPAFWRGWTMYLIAEGVQRHRRLHPSGRGTAVEHERVAAASGAAGAECSGRERIVPVDPARARHGGLPGADSLPDHVLGERLHRTRTRLRVGQCPHHLRRRRTLCRQHQPLTREIRFAGVGG